MRSGPAVARQPRSAGPRARGRPPRRWPAPARSPTGRRCWSSSSDGRAPRPALVASAAARALEERLAAHLPEAAVAVPRARSATWRCRPTARAWSGRRRRWPLVRDVARGRAPAAGPAPVRRSSRAGSSRGAALLRADLGRDRRADRARGPRPDRRAASRVAVAKRPLAWVPARRALFGRSARPARRAACRRGCCGAARRPAARERRDPRRRERPGAAAGARRLLRPDRRGAGAGRDRRRGDRQGQGRSGRPTWRRSRRRARCATTCRACSRRRRCPNGLPNPAHMEKARLPLAGAGRRLRGGARRTASARPGSGSPSRTCSPSRRCGSGRRCSASSTAGRARRPVEASAVAEAAAPAPPRSGLDAGDRERRRLLRPARLPAGRGDAPRRRRRLRPDGRRRRRGPGSPWSSTPASAPTPNRRRCSPPTPTRTLGRAAGPLAAPLRDRARPRARIRLRLAGRQRRRASASSSATRGSPGTSATTAARRPARPPATRSAAGRAGRGDGACRRRRPARRSSPPASGRRCCARPRAGTSPRRCSPRS